MIVCHCGVVNDREVVDTIRGGARTTAEVCRSTGAGRNCGTCIFSVRQLLRQHADLSVAEDRRAPDWAHAMEGVECAAG